MKYLFSFFSILMTFNINAQTIEGKWKTIDDETGKTRSIVEIYKRGDKFFGKVAQILDPEGNQEVLCEECDEDDPRYMKKVVGMEIIKDMKLDKNKNEYVGGEILDPESGNIYDCRIWLDEEGNLKLRGYLLFIYRTQTWLPLNG
ncbi:MAG: DUF2147 domain-containing protein [Cyclobacteriaceae bacterium]